MQRKLFSAKILAGMLSLISSALALDNHSFWSPDKRFYLNSFPPLDSKANQGRERERLIIYSAEGKEIAVAHVWLVEPDGTIRGGIRGCESAGWLNSALIFCKGTFNPYQSVELVFDAMTGQELQEILDPDNSL